MKQETTTEVAIPNIEIAKQLNNSVFSVIGADNLIGFEKAYLIANAAGQLKQLLNADYMKPIMALQGNKLGFKTDKDKTGGYPIEVVKNCLIEAVLTGVQPFGNQFNIIADNCYITKEGFGHLLSKIRGLSYKITPTLPRINADKSSAAIVMKIEWTIGGVTQKEEMDIPVKMNSFLGTDAVIGKATRKARAWLFNTINGTEIADGDTLDVDATLVSSKTNVDPKEKESERVRLMIGDAKNIDELEMLKETAIEYGQEEEYNQRELQFKS